MINKAAAAEILQQLGTDKTLFGKCFQKRDLEFEVMWQELVVSIEKREKMARAGAYACVPCRSKSAILLTNHSHSRFHARDD